MSYNSGMENTVRNHALLYACLCQEILQAFEKEQAERIIDEATFACGHVRGRRMRRNAEALGLAADINAYMICSELRMDAGKNRSSLSAADGKTVSCVTCCAWHRTWDEDNLLAYGKYYCRQIDAGITAGFNPDLHLEVIETMGINSNRCLFRGQGEADPAYIAAAKKRLDGCLVRSYSQHMEELVQTFQDVLSEYTPQAERLIQKAENAYRMYL